MRARDDGVAGDQIASSRSISVASTSLPSTPTAVSEPSVAPRVEG